LNDHHFERLGEFAREQGLDLRTEVAPCERVPFPDSSCDVILGLELIEHIESVPAFAKEVARLLAPGGIAILSTPARLKSILGDEEPHYHLRWLAILPFRLQGLIARRVFRRSYPFPITRQYLRASSVLRPFRRFGLKGSVRWTGRLAERFNRTPILGAIGRELLFNQLIVQRPKLS
jgi:SAM-dependent methyltransferase